MRSRVLVATVVLAAFMAGSARGGTDLVVSGHGWGHGVGMSQWGAYGYALHGWSYGRILRHYYPGTQLERIHAPFVRVLLAQGRKEITVGCATPLTVMDGRRYTRRLKAGTYGVGPKLVLPVLKNGRGRSFGRLAVLACSRSPLTLNGRAYHGRLILRSTGRALSVVNIVELDTYVRGVVPSESPSRWPLAELEAQAVAARSYAVSELRPDSTYDLLPDTRDQVYGGVAAERPSSDRAVSRTHGEVLTWDGHVARTYYSSSSGGRTEAVQDAWPGTAPIPYLRSVPDPWDVYSPHHTWGPYELSAARLAGRLGIAGDLESVHVKRDGSSRVSAVLVRLSSGRVVSLSGGRVARALRLRSTWFSIGELQLSTSASRVLYGGRLRVVAHAAGAKGAVLQQRSADGWWRTVRRARRGVLSLSLSLAARASTTFRLRLPGTHGTSVDVAVAPRVRVRALSRRLLGGAVVPRTEGPVRVWRRLPDGWRIVARPRLDARGSFRTPLRLRPSLYRITVGADGRLASAHMRLRVTRSLLASLGQ